MKICVTFLVFPGVELLDFAGPYSVFAALPDCTVRLVWKRIEPIKCSAGLVFQPTATMEDISESELLCVPGGTGINPLLLDEQVAAWIRSQALQARFVTSVCTGALLLGTAGLLAGRRATTHWRYLDLLSKLGAIPVKERVVQDRNLITGGGVTAGIDFGLAVVAALRGRTAAEEVQLALEYAPKPPFDAGEPQTAPPAVLSAILGQTQYLFNERERIIHQRHSMGNIR
jgi:cyclohexyl-isocyanide hydratase